LRPASTLASFHSPLHIIASMLTMSGICKAYGGRTLIDDGDLQVNRGDRIGVVGSNGAGKSTLFGLILGRTSPDAGSISLQRGVTIGELPQESAPATDDRVIDCAAGITPELADLRRQLRESANHDDGSHHGELCRRLDELDGRTLEARAKQMLAGLAFRPGDFERPLRELSGGWVMRAHLARLLVGEPDLLLLDEPTNHLDLEALIWLQNHLLSYPGGLLLISHDREFLNRLVGGIIEVRDGRLKKYTGNYDQYLEQRENDRVIQLAAYKNQQREIARLQVFADRFRAKNTKASQAQSKLKQIERMEKIAAPEDGEAVIHFKFPQPQRSGLKVIELVGVRQAYGAQVIYERLDFEVQRGQRIVLLGPNGAGKSTLLKLLAGVLTPQAGHRKLGHNAHVGYYAQYRVDMLDPERTVLEEALDTPHPLTEVSARTVLGSFLFRGDDVFKKVSVLSGGEKSRLALVKLLLDPPNLLLMDEPTNHLDIASTETLLRALQQFHGTVVFISHDVFFIRKLADHVVYVRDGRLRHYPGGYDYYLEKSAAETAAANPSVPRSILPVEEGQGARLRVQKRMEAEQRQARSQTRRRLQSEVHRLEKEIHRLETREAECTAAMEDPGTYQQTERIVELQLEFKRLHAKLRELNHAWESAATQLAKLDLEPSSRAT
jgi:ATP-binding cassette, subfamily F, member 3